mmetsp:Transcript_3589/g.8689  ORF Transcript_3589/g.8689 Transcript_3589/m.8689 type:complete len:240 (-) Transcript_3589:1870-2589(-)
MAATLPHEHPLKLLLDLALDHPAEIGRFICLLSVVVRSTARAATCIQRAANRWMLRTRAVRRIQRCLRLRIAQMGASAGRIARAWLGYSRRMLINRSASKIQHGARVMLRRKLSFWTSFLHDLQSAIGCNVEAQLVWDTALNADMGVNSINQNINHFWQAADSVFGLLVENEDAACASQDSRHCKTPSPEFAGIVLNIMLELSVDVETKMLCHRLLYLYNIAGASPIIILAVLSAVQST